MEDKLPVQIQEDAHLLANNHFYRLAEFFGIDDRIERLESKKALEEVLEWAKKASGSDEVVDILLEIRKVERGLGTDGEPRLSKLRRYIALQGDQDRINKEMELLKGKNE